MSKKQMILEEIDILKDKLAQACNMCAGYRQEIEKLKKEMALVREDAQVEIMRRDLRITQLEKINKEHQDLNGKLRLEINRLKGGM